MPKVIIKNMETGETGLIEWDHSTPVSFRVKFPDPAIVEEITKYLTKGREFWIPESQDLDDFRVDVVQPTQDGSYFVQALCGLHGQTGIWVDWPEPETEMD